MKEEHYIDKDDDFFMIRFDDFDFFTDKWVQYLTSNTAKKNLEVAYKNYYNEGETFQITAQYFDKNYELDENAQYP